MSITDRPHTISRRNFLEGSATLLLGFFVPPASAAQQSPTGASAATGRTFNAWLSIDRDNTVTLLCGQAEIGQGSSTGLAMVLAEELDCAWDQVRFVLRTGDAAYFHPIIYNREQITGGSLSIVAFAAPVRAAAARARLMLRQAAAARWQIGLDAVSTNAGVVYEPATQRRFTYGELAATAAALPIPDDAPLRTDSARRLVGTSPGRLDAASKCAGSAQFGIDVQVPGMLYAAIRHLPAARTPLPLIDDAAVLRRPGVRAVVPLPARTVALPGGQLHLRPAVAVVADSYWRAQQAADLLEVDLPAADQARDSVRHSAAITAHVAADTGAPGAIIALDEGNVGAALTAGDAFFEARYEVPLLAHATMEPMNCTARIVAGHCELWVPTQAPTIDREAAAAVLGIEPGAVDVHMTLAGGGFGRRGMADYVVQCALLAAAVDAPVKLIWSREEDIRNDYYRPAMACRMRATTAADGSPSAWDCQLSGARIFSYNRPQLVPEGLDVLAVEGANDWTYNVNRRRVTHTPEPSPVPIGYWRSIGYSHNTFFVESFIDELAARSAVDPYTYRARLLAGNERALEVLDTAAQRSDWGSGNQGIAFFESARWQVRLAQVVRLAPQRSGYRVEHVICAVDAGKLINPRLVEAQIMGAIVFGLTAALKGRITVRDGLVQQSNFHDYPLLRFDETPSIEVVLIEGATEPGSVGEVAVPPVAAAVANAYFAATGQRLRTLPLALGS